MKRLLAVTLFFSLASFVFLSTLVSAADYTCPVGQRIIKLAGQTNAHAESYNLNNPAYTTHICYDDWFGTFSGTPTRIPCSGSNVVLRVSAATNAHAELPGRNTPGYNDVCFDETLSCTAQAAPALCPAGYTEVASLSAATNAHLGINNSYNQAGNYRICCRAGPVPPQCSDGLDNDNDGATDYPNDFSCDSASDTDETTPRAQCQDGINNNDNDALIDYPADPDCTSLQDNSEGLGSLLYAAWRDNAGKTIGENVGINTWVNRTVRAIEHTSFPEGTSVRLEVWEDDALLPHDLLASYTLSTLADGRAAVFNYLINDANITAAREAGEGDFLEFYFIAFASGQQNRSDNLLVNMSEGPNTPPTALITAPVHRGIYYRNTEVTFKQGSTDNEGGQLQYLWTIAEDNFTSTSATFDYTFTSAGQKTVTLRVTDPDGSWDEDQVALVVVSSPGIFAFINEPRHQQLLINDSLRIKLNASDSYVVNSSVSCPAYNVTCLAGRCPSQTQNAPSGCPQNLTVMRTPRGYNEIYFDWSFNDGDNAATSDGYNAPYITKEFAAPSKTLDDYKEARLALNYSNATVGILSLTQSTNRLFTLLSADQCINNGNTWVEYNYSTGEIISEHSTLTTNRCKGRDNINGTSDDCCPIGTACTENGCIASNITICAQITDRNDCINAPSHIYNNPDNPGYNEPPACGSIVNGSVIKCRCGWFNSTFCALNKSSSPGSWGGDDPTCTPSSCIYPPVAPPSECINGYATVTVTAEYIAGTCAGGMTQEECLAGAGERTILCGRPSVSLGFFGFWQFIITFIMIFIIYAAWRSMKHQ